MSAGRGLPLARARPAGRAGDVATAGQESGMLALFSARFRRLLILMIAVPLGGRVLDALGTRIEATSGPNRLSRAMHTAGRAARHYSGRPLPPEDARPAADEAGLTSTGQSLNGQSPNGQASYGSAPRRQRRGLR